MHFEYRNIVIVVSFIVIFVVSKRRYIVNNTTSIEFARSTTDGYRKFGIVDKSMSIESKLNTKNEIQNRIWKGFFTYGTTQWAAVTPHSLLMIPAPHACSLFALYDNYCR